MSERQAKVSFERLIVDSLVKDLQLKFHGKIVPWREFSALVELPVVKRGVCLEILSAPTDIQKFLEEFTRARMAGNTEFEKFLERHKKDPDEFFEKRVGPSPTDSRYLTVAQTTRVITFFLTAGWQFSFNGNNIP